MVIGTAEANVCRMGELLKEMPKAAGSRGIGKKVEFSAGTPLADLGVTKKQSHIAQRVASVPTKVIGTGGSLLGSGGEASSFTG